jgi:cutinase
MKFFTASLLASIAAASPIGINLDPNNLEARQLSSGSKSELESGTAGACPKTILVFARGSTETGNLVRILVLHQ